MINLALGFLKNKLNNYLRIKNGSHDQQEDQVVFVSGSASESISFKFGAVTLLLVRLAQENVLRAPDLYRRTMADGSVQNAAPDIRLELFVLCVAHYPQYEDALKMLSAVISYFQNNRIITHESAPDLNEELQQLVVELVPLSFAEQNEVWSSLRISYLPSALYKIKMVVYQADAGEDAALVTEQRIGVKG